MTVDDRLDNSKNWTNSMPRRFPPPWSVDEADSKLDRRSFIVRHANGQALADVYFEDEPERRAAARAAVAWTKARVGNLERHDLGHRGADRRLPFDRSSPAPPDREDPHPTGSCCRRRVTVEIP
jgi:hypothetical protein